MLEQRTVAAGLPPNPHGRNLANVSIIMCTIAGFFVICRLLTRAFIHRLTGWDDYTLVFAMCLAIGITICFNMEVYYGMGLHTYEVHNKHYKTMAFTWLWAAQLLYKFANGITKISIVLLYMRIFPIRRFKILSWCVIAYVIAYCTAAILLSIFQCSPIEKAWHKTIPGHCLDIGKLWYANSVLTIVADVMLIFLPLKQIVRLQLPTAQKVGLGIVFSLGVFVMACTIIRCVDLGPTTSKKDPMYYQAVSNSWTFLEVDVGIICASLPLLKAPLKLLFPKIFGDRKTSRRRSYNSHNYYNNNGNSFVMSDGRGSVARVGVGKKFSLSLSRSAHDDLDGDAASDEETIVGGYGHELEGAERGIVKTMEVTLDSYEVERVEELDRIDETEEEERGGGGGGGDVVGQAV